MLNGSIWINHSSTTYWRFERIEMRSRSDIDANFQFNPAASCAARSLKQVAETSL